MKNYIELNYLGHKYQERTKEINVADQSKNIKAKYYRIHQEISDSSTKITMTHIASNENPADLLTKNTETKVMTKLKNRLLHNDTIPIVDTNKSQEIKIA